MAKEKGTGRSQRVAIELPTLISEKRAHPRWSSWLIPALLRTEAHEAIPATILNLSATGLLALVDGRFAPGLPAGEGMHLFARFFLDDLEIRDLELKIVRVENRGNQLINIGCQFVGTLAEARRATSAKVDVLLTSRSPDAAAPSAKRKAQPPRRGAVQRHLKRVPAGYKEGIKRKTS